MEFEFEAGVRWKIIIGLLEIFNGRNHGVLAVEGKHASQIDLNSNSLFVAPGVAVKRRNGLFMAGLRTLLFLGSGRTTWEVFLR